MSFWKTKTNTTLRVYFKVIRNGNLVTGLTSSVFQTLIITPNDSDSLALGVTQSSQLPGVYYTDLDNPFLISNGPGMYGLSIGIHKPDPNAINDEVLYPIDVTSNDIDEIYSKTKELWQLHGLDPDNELTVDQSGRSVDGITQVFTKVGDELKVNRN